MDSFIYEPHLLKGGSLPFIFHYDSLSERPSPGGAPEGISYLSYGKKCTQNWHENAEFLYIAKGSGVLCCDSSEYPVKEGAICAVSSLELHYTKTDSRLEYYCLIPDSAFLLQNGIDTSHLEFCHVIESDKISAAFSRFISAYLSKDSFREAKIRLGALNLILEIAENYSSQKKASGSAKSLDRLKKAISYINGHMAERISADDVARAASLSKYYFLREFKALTGQTLVDFVNNLRCEKARAMLAQGELSVSEIASLCGFNGASYFSRVFYESAGLTPKEYRRLYSGDKI